MANDAEEMAKQAGKTAVKVATTMGMAILRSKFNLLIILLLMLISSNSSVGAVTSKAQNDFNGDGTSDILWRNTTTGDNLIWKINPATMTLSGNAIPLNNVMINSGWQIAGTGDFNGDGTSDILWRNSNTGDNLIWKINPSTMTLSGNAITLDNVAINSGWQFAGIGDFNGDGTSDILWRNTTTGDNLIWKINPSTMTRTESYKMLNNVTINSGWQIAGTGDFNGDRTSDILWRNTTTGDNLIWKINPSTMTQTDPLINLNNVAINLGWNIAGTFTTLLPYYSNIESVLNNFFSNTANIPIANRVENWSGKTITQMWDRVGGESAQFPGLADTHEFNKEDLWNVDMPTDVYNIYKDLSTAIFGSLRPVTAGYAYDYGYYVDEGSHSALDIDDANNATVKAAVTGKVVAVLPKGSIGYWIAINELDASGNKTGRRWWYGHLTNSQVQLNNIVNAGQNIAQLYSVSPFPSHLHLTVVNTYTDTADFSEVLNGKTGNYTNDVNYVLNRTMSPLQAYWKSRNGIKE